MNIDGIDIVKYLGEGAFAKTYLCQKNGKRQAIKIFNPKESTKKKLKYIEHEINMLRLFRSSKYIVNMNEFNVQKYSSYITFEVLGQSLYQFIKHHKKKGLQIPLPTIQNISRQILYGLIELKRNGILHADLKPENILFLDKNTIKIIDLGNSMLERDFAKNQTVQTRHYRPPECIIKAGFGYSADMWAFACIVFEMLTNTLLFDPRRDGTMSTNSCHLAMFIKTFGDIPLDFLESGASSHKYIDLSNNVHKFQYLIGERCTLCDILVKYYPENTARALSGFLEKIFVYEPQKRVTPEECLNLEFLNKSTA